MTSLNLDERQLKQLEMSRSRLFQLCSNLVALKNMVEQGNRNGDPLPDPEALQKQMAILVRNLEVMNSVLTENHPLFSRITVHPSTNYPGRTQEGILQQLLRKKLEPELEDWVEEGRAAALAAGMDASKIGGGKNIRRDDDDEDDEEGYPDEEDDGQDVLAQIWKDARQIYYNRIAYYQKHEEGMNYTLAEKAIGIEKVRTGLQRDLDDSDDEEEEEEASTQAAQVAGPKPLEPEYLLALAARGDTNLPPSLRTELQRKGR